MSGTIKKIKQSYSAIPMCGFREGRETMDPLEKEEEAHDI